MSFKCEKAIAQDTFKVELQRLHDALSPSSLRARAGTGGLNFFIGNAFGGRSDSSLGRSGSSLGTPKSRQAA